MLGMASPPRFVALCLSGPTVDPSIRTRRNRSSDASTTECLCQSSSPGVTRRLLTHASRHACVVYATGLSRRLRREARRRASPCVSSERRRIAVNEKETVSTAADQRSPRQQSCGYATRCGASLHNSYAHRAQSAPSFHRRDVPPGVRNTSAAPLSHRLHSRRSAIHNRNAALMCQSVDSRRTRIRAAA